MFGRGQAPTEPTAPAAPAAASTPAPAATQTAEDRLAGIFVEPTSEVVRVDNPLTKTKELIYARLMEQIDLQTASRMPQDELRRQIIDVIGEIVMEQKLAINQSEQQVLAAQIVDDMIGLGPLEPLLLDELITDIMVNGPDQVYIERKGKLELANVRFRDNDHVMNIAQRIVTAIGRRVDESSPICDARLKDGSRVNVIAPGPVETDMAKLVHTPQIRADYHDAIPLARYGTLQEMADAVGFLCSDAASFINGQVLAVDGGFDAAGVGLPSLRRFGAATSGQG